MSRKRFYVPLIAAITAMFLVAMVGVAAADTITTDGDSLTISGSPNPSVSDCTVQHLFNGSARVNYQGGSHFVAGTSLTVSVSAAVGITAVYTGGTVSVDSDWNDNTDDFTFTGVDTTVPAAVSSGTYAVTVEVSGSKVGGGSLTISDFFNVNVTCASTNNPPTVDAGGPYSGDEGSAIALDGGSASDGDGSIVSTAWTIFSQTGGGTCTLANASSLTSATITCTDNGSATVRLTATDDDGASASADAAVTVNNADPVVTASMNATPVDCRTNTTLTWSFTDAGVNDGPWAVVIDWNDPDDATNESFNALTQGSQTARTHTYVTPGTYLVDVSVTDKDGGTGTDNGNSITISQTYAVDFLPPFDDSTPSGLIVNKMKNGRVVPVKATIYDECALEFVTDPSTVVTIETSKTSGSGYGDPIEQYADAGESNAGTNAFRFADGFWIYNLDSKALGLIVNNLYRVDIYVGAVKATGDTWGVLQPVK